MSKFLKLHEDCYVVLREGDGSLHGVGTLELKGYALVPLEDCEAHTERMWQALEALAAENKDVQGGVVARWAGRYLYVIDNIDDECSDLQIFDLSDQSVSTISIGNDVRFVRSIDGHIQRQDLKDGAWKTCEFDI